MIWRMSDSMNISLPIASSIGSVDFGFLSSQDIRALSVKKVINPTTFDTLLHPVPGGLYDPALGAWSDNPCVLHSQMRLLLANFRKMWNMSLEYFHLSWPCRSYRITGSDLPCHLLRPDDTPVERQMRLLSSFEASSSRGQSLCL